MAHCDHCELELEGEPVVDADVDGRYCCRGCLEVSKLVAETDGEPVDRRIEEPDVPDEAATVDATVDGMHCLTCEQFLETIAADLDGVHDVRASYVTEAVRVWFDADAIAAETIVEELNGFGYRASLPEEDDPRQRDRLEFSRYRAVIAVIVAMPVMALYVLFVYPTYLGLYPASFLEQSDARMLVVMPITVWSTIVLVGLGYPYLRGAYVSLTVGQPNMDLLVAIAVVAAYGYSIVTVANGGRELYFDVVVMVLVVVTVGHHLESRMKRTALENYVALTENESRIARIIGDDGETREVSPGNCRKGDRVLVRSGERIPVDGTIVEGTAAVNEALVSGESTPHSKTVGDDVVGGAVVADGALEIEVSPAARSTLDTLVDQMRHVQSREGGIQRAVNTFSVVFVPLVIVLAVVAAGGWLLQGAGVTTALVVGVTVLLVSCPCSLGIATPLALARGVRDATDRGIAVLQSSALEGLARSNIVVVDKTGTVTTGMMTVERIVTTANTDETTLRSRAAAIESRSSHPIAEAIVAAADDPTAPVSGFERNGRAVSGVVDGVRVTVGHPDELADDVWTVPDRIHEAIDEAFDDGEFPTLVGWDGTVRGVITVRDEPRAGWADVVSDLAADDRELVLLTGDDERMTRRFADHPAVDQVFADVRPESKESIVRGLRARGRTMMVGDGTNDAPALAAADLGVALGSGTDLAIDAADVVVVDDDLSAVPALFDIARRSRRRIRSNLLWAAGYNAVAIPLAAFGFINPLLAALLMALSSLLVVANSARNTTTGGIGR